MVESGFFKNIVQPLMLISATANINEAAPLGASMSVLNDFLEGASNFQPEFHFAIGFFSRKSFCQPCSAASIDAQHSAVTCVYHIAVLHGLCSVDHAHIMHGTSCVLSYSTFDFFSHKTHVSILY